MNSDETVSPDEVPEVIYGASSTAPLRIAVPELLDFRASEVVLMREPIAPTVPAFIFPGIILGRPSGAALFIPASDLPLLEGAGAADDQLSFTYAGASHVLAEAQIAQFGHRVDIRLREALPSTSRLVVHGGSLLRDTRERLYYLPAGAFATLRSITEALEGRAGT
ncbi:hypothetical protein [Nocardioides sp. Iso805N]|uniref:hypothetical protein n=1 Tax=Nocardioides sp. Iso805N TaxID=1283287 RepID=UPI000376A2A9|nr:hypothetical protein [Nocardioides sp. Iso805N]